jgi:hypothetical protein
MDALTVTLAVTNAVTGVIAVCLAAYGLKQNQRRTEVETELQRERDAREEDRRHERERRETLRERPVVVVEHDGATGDGSPLERRLVKLRVANRGPSAAYSVEVGIRMGDNDMCAGPTGTPAVLPVLSPEQTATLIVQVDRSIWSTRPLVEVDTPPLWARWTDALGNPFGWRSD